MEKQDSQHTVIPAEIRETQVTVTYVPRHVEVYQLLGEELDAIAGGAHSIHLTLFGISIGALVALAITLGTGQVTSVLAFSGFVGALVAAFGLSTLFGLLALRDWHRHQALIRNIKQARRRAG